MQNLRRVVKNDGPILSLLLTKVHGILRRCRRPFVVSNAFGRLYISEKCFFQRHKPLPSNCKIVKKVVLGPQFVGEEIPDFGHTFSNRTHFRACGCGRFWWSYVPGARRVLTKKARRSKKNRGKT